PGFQGTEPGFSDVPRPVADARPSQGRQRTGARIALSALLACRLSLKRRFCQPRAHLEHLEQARAGSGRLGRDVAGRGTSSLAISAVASRKERWRTFARPTVRCWLGITRVVRLRRLTSSPSEA